MKPDYVSGSLRGHQFMRDGLFVQIGKVGCLHLHETLQAQHCLQPAHAARVQHPLTHWRFIRAKLDEYDFLNVRRAVSALALNAELDIHAAVPALFPFGDLRSHFLNKFRIGGALWAFRLHYDRRVVVGNSEYQVRIHFAVVHVVVVLLALRIDLHSGCHCCQQRIQKAATKCD